MNATIIDLSGNDAGDVDLPAVFETAHRPDLIRQAVAASRANRTQPYGSDPYAGMRSSAEAFGSGQGRARLPRANNRTVRVPQAVGGRRAHPPKSEKDHGKGVNDQERQLATQSAISATADRVLVAERGHAFPESATLPLIVSDAFEDLEKTRDVVSFLEAIELDADIERAEDGKTVRSGRGTMRGRKYRQPKSILFVTSSEAGPSRAARNLAGADVATAAEVNVEDLAPGGEAGRLTIWTESALAEVADR